MDELEPSIPGIKRLILFTGTTKTYEILSRIIELIDHPYFRLVLDIFKDTTNKNQVSKRYKQVIKGKNILPDKDNAYHNIAHYLNTGLIGGSYVLKMGLSTVDAYSSFIFHSIGEDILDTNFFIEIVDESIKDKKLLMKYAIVKSISSKYSISGIAAGIKYESLYEKAKESNLIPMRAYLLKLYENEMSTEEFVKWYLSLRVIDDAVKNG